MREQVEDRAGHRCEYCRAPQGICAYTFHIDHIAPRSKGGADAFANYALACFPCNNATRDFMTGVDPATGADVPLFHPRLQKWEDHFAFSRSFAASEAGRRLDARRVERLKMNERLQVKARPLWVETGVWP